MDPTDTGDLPNVLHGRSLDTLLTYRKIAMAVVSAYLELPADFTDAILADQMDEYLAASFNDREMSKRNDYAAYLTLLSKEAVVRYAGTAAEGLVAPPESELARKRVMGDTGGLGTTDDINVVLRVHELFAALEVPGGDGASGAEANTILDIVKRQTCNYYNASAYFLVREKLLPVILETAELIYRKEKKSASLTANRIVALLDKRELLLP